MVIDSQIRIAVPRGLQPTTRWPVVCIYPQKPVAIIHRRWLAKEILSTLRKPFPAAEASFILEGSHGLGNEMNVIPQQRQKWSTYGSVPVAMPPKRSVALYFFPIATSLCEVHSIGLSPIDRISWVPKPPRAGSPLFGRGKSGLSGCDSGPSASD